MNENTEVRDELAGLAGWIRYSTGGCRNVDGRFSFDPIPNTIDAAATLPEGWVYDYVDFCLGPIVACAKKNGEHVHGEGPTELAARFALRLAVEKIEHERKNK